VSAGQARHHGDGEAVPDQAGGSRVVGRLESHAGRESGLRARAGQRHPVRVVGCPRDEGLVPQAAPRVFGEVMGELFALIAAGVLIPGRPAAYDLADSPKALAELEARVTVGKLALLP
jgi:NADPH:quinone reductase